jgi:hypothetical protein
VNVRKLKVGALVKKKFSDELGMLIEVQRSHEVDPNVHRFRILWCKLGFNWDCRKDFEVIR